MGEKQLGSESFGLGEVVHPLTLPTYNLEDYTSEDEGVRRRFVEGIGHGLSGVGFVCLKSQKLKGELFKQAYKLAERFFALPQEVKEKYFYPHLSSQVGYVGFGKEKAKGMKHYDLKEFWHVSREAVEAVGEGRSGGCSSQKVLLWPEEVPEWASVLSDIYQTLEECAGQVLEVCALYLGLERTLLRDFTTAPSPSLLRILHYPPLDFKRVPVGALRAAPHEDINFITLLSAGTAKGLEIQDHGGRWCRLEGLTGGELIVGAGDMLQNITCGQIRSTTHRVVNPDQLGGSRYSMPFFLHPHPRTDLTPLPHCVNRSPFSKTEVPYPSLTAGEYLAQRLREIELKPL